MKTQLAPYDEARIDSIATSPPTPRGAHRPAQARGVPPVEAPVQTDDQPLSAFLATVAQIVKRQAPRAWVSAEISRVQDKQHLYLELVEHDAAGREVAKSRACVWNGKKLPLLKKFRDGTGSDLCDGIKVLLRVEATFHAQYGFSLVVDDIDPSYTLGDMERKLIMIRDRLKTEGCYDQNRRHATPCEFTRVAVISPPDAAGLGDFRAGANRLESAGLCRFDYYAATFQGAETARGIVGQMRQVWRAHAAAGTQGYDALVVIRGGGAATDLAWLNEYEIALAVCRMNLPVFTGIGHQQDNTLLDELAHTRFDTPSKVIGHIQTVICDRAREALKDWHFIRDCAERTHAGVQGRLRDGFAALSQRMQHDVQRCQTAVRAHYECVDEKAREQLQSRRRDIVARHGEIEWSAGNAMDRLRADLDGQWHAVQTHARHQKQTARQALDAGKTALVARMRSDQALCRQQAMQDMECVEERSRESLDRARRDMRALRAEIDLRARNAVDCVRLEMLDGWQNIQSRARQGCQQRRQDMAVARDFLTNLMQNGLRYSREALTGCFAVVRDKADVALRDGSRRVDDWHAGIIRGARADVRQVGDHIGTCQAGITSQARHALERGRAELDTRQREIAAQARFRAESAATRLRARRDDVDGGARAQADRAKREIEYRMAEVLGLGPARTLARGYAIVHVDGAVITRAAQARQAAAIQIEFTDGVVDWPADGRR